MELTTSCQFLLAPGMMAADDTSGLSQAERHTVIGWLYTADVPPAWKPRIQAYVDVRQSQRKGGAPR